MDSLFAGIYCINLDRREDRWQRFEASIPADWPFRPIERVPAIDGKRAPAPTWWQQGNAAWGCYRSHLRLIEDALNRGLNSIMLLEDDAVFCEGFSMKAAKFFEALPENWGYAYLGGQHLFVDNKPPVQINDHVFRSYNVNRTHAFCLRGQALAKVYRHLCRNDWLTKSHIDHHLGRFHESGDEPVYCPTEWLVGQDEGISDICGRTTPQRYWPHAESVSKTDHVLQPFVAVLGLHSSGSSCLAGVLHHLGLHLGNHLGGFYGNQPDKNHCGFEAAGLRDICEAAVPFPSCQLALSYEEVTAKLRRWINDRRREAAKRGTLAAGKYPQLCRLGPSLRAICGDHLRLIVSDRPLSVSIESLTRRSANQPRTQIQKHQKWLNAGKRALWAETPEPHRLLVSYDELVDDPRRQIVRIARFLNLSPNEDQMIAALGWVSRDKQHLREGHVAVPAKGLTAGRPAGQSRSRNRCGCVPATK